MLMRPFCSDLAQAPALASDAAAEPAVASMPSIEVCQFATAIVLDTESICIEDHPRKPYVQCTAYH